MPTSDSRDYELIDRLAEEFAKRFRDGERPSVREYCDKYPHIADDLREMLPALAEVEQVKDEAQAPPTVEPPKLRQVDEYHILREVGRGGMGVVYEAEDTRLTRRVALKVLATGKAGHALERFKREARAAARLHHTNIVPVFGVGDHDGLPYYVMQFIQGLGLDEVLDEVKRLQQKSGSAVLPSAVSARPRRKDISAAAVARSLVTGTFEPPANVEAAETLTHAPAAPIGQVSNLSSPSGQVGNLSYSSLPGQSNLSGRKLTYWQSVAQIGLQVADALDYAHKQGILHRDIKPSNLLLDLHGVVWVTDFGLAKAADQEDLTHTGDVLGTLRYMPPEAFEGKSEARSDVYSLGLSMYELLALRPAYDERKKEQLVKQVTTTDPPRLGTLNRAIPRDLQTIVHKAIEKDPDHRYKSAGDLAADLRRFLGDLTILARRVSPTERFARWCKRNPTVAGLTAAVFLLLLSVAGVASLLAVRIEKKAQEAQDAADRANTALAAEAAERERANQEAERKTRALEEATRERRRTEELIGEQFVSRGAGLLAQGDVAGAALCYAQALKLDPNDPDRALTHRIRLTAALRDAPRPRHVLNHPARVVCAVPSADGKLLATGCEDRAVRVWDLATGEPAGPPLKFEHDVDFVNFAAGNKRLWVLTKRPAAPPAKADWDDADDDPPPAPAPFEASLWDRETGKMVFSGRRNYATQFALVDPATGRGMVAFNPEPNVLETRDRDTAEPTHPPLRLPGQNTWSTASLRAGREVVACRVEPKPVEPKPAPKTTRKSGRPGGPVLLSELRVFDSRTGAPVFQTPPSPGDAAVVCGTDDRFLVVAEAAGAIQWYELATGKKGPRVERPAGLAPGGPAALAVTGDHRRLLVTYSEETRTRAPPTAEVRVLDADTGAEVSGFTPDRPVTTGRVAVVPNIDASRFFRGEGAAHLLRADGSSLADQPDATAGAALAFSPDGGFLLTAAADNMIRVWDAWTGKPVTPRLPHEGPVRTADFTPDGSHVLTVGGTAVRLWPLARADQGARVRLEAAGVRRVLSADGTRLLEYPFGPVGEQTVRVIDCATGRVVAGPLRLGPEDAGGFRLVVASFRPDGRGALFVLREPRRKGAEGDIQSPTRVLSWDCDGSPPNELFATESPNLASAEYSPDGRFVRVTVAQDDYRVRLWDAATGQPVGTGVRIARPKQGSRKDSLFTAVSVGTWSPDSAVLAHRDAAGVHLYDARTGAEVGPPIPFDADRVQPEVFSDDGSRLMTVEGGLRLRFGGGSEAPGSKALTGRVRVWDARTVRAVGPPLTGDRLNGVIASARLSPAGDRVAVVMAAATGPQAVRASSDFGTGLAVYLWDPAAGRPTAEPLLHDQPVTRLAFSPDGQWLLTGTARHLRLWSAATGELQRMIPTAETIADAAFSPDGRRIVVRLSQTAGDRPFGTRSPAFIQVWDVRTGQPMTPPLRGISQPGPGGPGGFRPGSAAVPEAEFGDRSRNADRLLVARDDGSPELYSLAGDDRPAADLVGLTELLSTRQVNTAGVIQGLGPAGFRVAWEGRRPTAGPDWAGTPIEGNAWDRFCLPRSAPFGGLAFPAARPLLLAPERNAQYLWHLDRLLAADLKDADLHALRGYALNNRGDPAGAEAAFGRALDLGTANRTALLVSRGNLRAELGRWADAEADLGEFLTAPRPKQAGFPGNGPSPVRASLAVLRLRREDLPAYRAECARLLDESNQVPPSFGAGTESQFAYLWPALLTNGAVPNLTDVLRDLPVPSWAADNGTGPFNLMVGLRYRQERYEEVERRFSGLLQPTRSDYYFLAMAQHKLGKAEARATLEKANTLHVVGGPVRPIATGFAITGTMTTWQHKVAEETLRREAEALILGKK